MPSLPPLPALADAGALSFSFGFLGGSGGGSFGAGAAYRSATPLLSFGFLGSEPAAAPSVVAVVGSGTSGFPSSLVAAVAVVV
jgi:hypothetical protein